MELPQHIGIIMDGNGRWASARNLPRTAGHKKGAEIVQTILEHANKRGIRTVTLFAFSSENWARPKEEVDTLLRLFNKYLNEDIKKIMEQDARLSFVGDKSRFPAEMQQKMIEVEEKTSTNQGLHVVLALSYGARDDITQAMRKIGAKIAAGTLQPQDITVETVSSHLSTAGLIPPDLIIRTSGEQRLSNFLLWEAAYSELYFTPVFWPDFTSEEFDKALNAYCTRNRRFGKV